MSTRASFGRRVGLDQPLATDTAMVLAAGLGKRMRPLTATRPKPLVPVAGKPLIDHVLDRLAESGIARAVVNVHYFADALEAHMAVRARQGLGPQVTISNERGQLLETGGGMVHAARAGLLPDTFFAINSDNIWLDGPRDALRELTANWDPARMDGLLLMVRHTAAHNYRGPGDFQLDPLGRVSRRAPRKIAPFIWTGIQLLSQRFLADAPDGAFSTNVLWDRAIAAGRLYGCVHTGEWCEVGEPRAIAPTEALLARV